MNKKVSASRKIIMTLLSFCLSVLVALTGILCVTIVTIMNSKYAVNSLEKSEFGEVELDRIREHFISYGSAGNVEESFFIDYFEKNITAKIVTDDMALSIRALYSGDDIDDTEYFFDNLYSALLKYAEDMYMDIEDEDVIEGIRQFTHDLIKLYQRYVSFPYASTISPVLEKADGLAPIAAAALTLLSIAIVAVILLSYKKKSVPLSYLGSSFGGAGLMLIVFPALVFITRQAEKFSLTDAAFRSFFIEFMNGFMSSLIICGVVLLVFCVLLFFSGNRLKTSTACAANKKL